MPKDLGNINEYKDMDLLALVDSHSENNSYEEVGLNLS